MFNTSFSKYVFSCANTLSLLFAISAGSSVLAERVAFRLDTLDMSGQSVTQVNVGDEFLLRGLVQDIREENADGVFAAYVDVTYDSSMVAASPPITYGSVYDNFRTEAADVFATEGLLDEIGGFSNINTLGSEEIMLFEVSMQATSIGDASFATNAADDSPLHDVLLYNDDVRIPLDDISFSGKSLSIVPEPSGQPLIIVLLSLLAVGRKTWRIQYR